RCGMDGMGRCVEECHERKAHTRTYPRLFIVCFQCRRETSRVFPRTKMSARNCRWNVFAVRSAALPPLVARNERCHHSMQGRVIADGCAAWQPLALFACVIDDADCSSAAYLY